MAWLRLMLYFGGVAGLLAVLVGLESRYPGTLRLEVTVDGASTSEFSPIETGQTLMLIVSGVILALVARGYAPQRPLAVLVGGIVLVCLLRELDFFLDRFVADGAWMMLTGVSVALVIAYVYRHRKRLSIALNRTWPSPGLLLLYAGSIVLFALAPILSFEPLWQSMMGDGYESRVTVAVDEFVELAGYLVCFSGIVEYSIEVRALAVREPAPIAVKRRRTRLGRKR